MLMGRSSTEVNPGGGVVSRKVNGADGIASKMTAPSPSSSQTSNPSSTTAKHAPGSGCSEASTAMTVNRPGASPGSMAGWSTASSSG
jgi:hypothetical protein